ncbi:MAG TPA: hypothetical protein VKE88_02655 [Candidatus Nanoarchaeia archaeon]|nr:hypothetical protein [Candidatus Nanoarchaeia archaeon]
MAVTYEMLFEILRKEKNHEELQKLHESFFGEVKGYLSEKNAALQERTRLDQFTEGSENEQAALRIQIHNIKKLIKDIIDRRERKVIEMALNKAKTEANIIDTSLLLPEESSFFEQQIRVIQGFRTAILEVPSSVQEAPKPKDLNMAPGEKSVKELKKVHIIESVPKFVGVDLEVYGPYNTSDEIELHQMIADMLIKTNKAKIVE